MATLLFCASTGLTWPCSCQTCWPCWGVLMHPIVVRSSDNPSHSQPAQSLLLCGPTKICQLPVSVATSLVLLLVAAGCLLSQNIQARGHQYLASNNYPARRLTTSHKKVFRFSIPPFLLLLSLLVFHDHPHPPPQCCKNTFSANLTARFYESQVLKLTQTSNDSLARYFENLFIFKIFKGVFS